MLELGTSAALSVRREEVLAAGSRCALTLLYASDLHLTRRRSAVVATSISSIAREMQPDAILLGGDLVDFPTATSDLSKMVEELVQCAPVGAIPGNHDSFSGTERVCRAVREAGGVWLPDDSIELCGENNPVLIAGKVDMLSNHSGVRVLCAHNPDIFPEAVRGGVHLVLAGHLHGGQVVLGSWRKKLYPGAFFFAWNGLRFDEGDSTMIVSRGVADTLPIRFRCPREVIECQI